MEGASEEDRAFALNRPLVLKRYKFIYGRFRSRYQYWASTLLFRRVQFAIILVLFSSYLRIQAGLALFVLALQMSKQAKCEPFLKKSLNDLEFSCLVCLAFQIVFGIVFSTPDWRHPIYAEVGLLFLLWYNMTLAGAGTNT